MRTSQIFEAAAALFLFVAGSGSAPIANAHRQPANALRVCADPNTLPFSNRKGEGFENKLAEMAARDLHRPLVYVFAPEHEDFVKNTLDKDACDVVMGLPAGYGDAELTKPYYRSGYVFVTRADRKLDLHSLKDKRLNKLKIGVHLIGDADTPPMAVFTREGIVNNVVGFLIYGDQSKANPPARLIDAVSDGKIDVAAAWGPLAGYFAQRSPVKLSVTPIGDTADFAPLLFQYDVAMGVRPGNNALRSKLDAILERRRTDIRNLLTRYGVPLMSEP
jgi:quinoprotein dehydrogenase-associated probable ABC transporter substrate-binding protein